MFIEDLKKQNPQLQAWSLERPLVTYRRSLHAIAEAGWQEQRTTLKLAEELARLGYHLELGRQLHGPDRLGLDEDKTPQQRPSDQELDQAIARLNTVSQGRQNFAIERLREDLKEHYTGLTADWDTGQPGPYVCLRIDMDALAIAESQSPQHRPYREGFRQSSGEACHACGHDGHMALALCLAQILQNNPQIKGRYRFIFQSAEEGCRGAHSMSAQNLAQGADYFIGYHLGLGLPSGKYGIGTVNFLSSETYRLDLKGRAAHAGNAPEKGRNALLCAAALAIELYSLSQYGNGKAFVNAGRLEAGELANSIASQAMLLFQLRASDGKVMADLREKCLRMIEGLCSAHEIEFKLSNLGRAGSLKSQYLQGYTRLSKELTQFLDTRGFATILQPEFKASEDVVSWMNQVWDAGGQAMHLMLGCDITAPHHHGDFDLDEEALTPALALLESCLIWLSQNR